MYKHILVPTDGSALSLKAAREAVRLARVHKAKITAIHVIPLFQPAVYTDGFIGYPEMFSPKEYKKITERDAAKMLADVAAVARAARVRCETVFVSSSDPWEAIIQAARARKCDLIAMASHGRRGLESVLLGSETTKVLTHSKIPVLVCR